MRFTEHQMDVLTKLADSIEKIEVEQDTIQIKFKGNVIIKNKNFVNLSDGFNINYANQIHFNPDYPNKKEFEAKINKIEMMKIEMVKNILKNLGQDVMEEDIKDIINGDKQIETIVEELEIKKCEK
jgi:hypothetical protein